MKSNTFTIADLFTANRRYIVPLFQRPYVWEMNKQWKPLWEDIVGKTDQILNPPANSRQQPRSHFLGAVVINQIPTFGKQVPAMEVIDGQQRMTTLQVLFLALRDFAKSAGVSDVTQTLVQLTENGMLRETEVERYKVWPTTTDRAVFEAVAKAASPAAVEQQFPLLRIKYTKRHYPRPRIAEAYLFFYRAIDDYVRAVSIEAAEDEEIQLLAPLEEVAPDMLEPVEVEQTDIAQPQLVLERLYGIMQALTKHLELVVIELEERDDPQVIFETLNARGEPLLPSDLIRNFVFLTAARQQSDVTKLYNTYWQPLDESTSTQGALWKQEVRQGRLKRPLIDLFFFHYLTYRKGSELAIQHVFQEFREWWNHRSPQVEPELTAIQNYSELFKQFYTGLTANRQDIFAWRLRILDTSTVYPLLLLILGGEKGALDPQERDGILVDLESYLVRRMICGLTTKNYNRVFLSLLAKLRAAPNITRSGVQQLLIDQQGDSGRWPNDDEFRTAWLHVPVYRTLSTQRVTMILEALEWQHYSTKQEADPLRAKSYSIEHILPQHPSDEDWPLIPLDTSTAMQQEAIDIRNLRTHTFGNLTLVTQALNSSLSNSAFAIKKQHLDDHSVLMLNKYFAKQSTWSESSIRERGEWLFALAQEVWPGPERI